MLQSIILIDPEAILAAKPDSNTLVVEVPEDKKEISVDQIRSLVAWAGQFGFATGAKRAIICQAQHLSLAAANTLLKTLEEPTEQTTLILTVDTAGSLLPTIRSRCAVYRVDELSQDQLAEWGLERRPPTEAEVPLSWSDFAAQPALARWQTVEEWLKAKQDMKTVLRAWQRQLHQSLSTAEDDTLEQVIARASLLDRSLRDLEANSNPRLVFDEVLLAIET